MVIAGIPDPITGGNIGTVSPRLRFATFADFRSTANFCFSLCLVFNGVLSPPTGPNAFPHFWIFMYRISPFTYLGA